MKKLLVTLDINYSKEITDLTFPYMVEYAKNINADFKVITERKYPELPIPIEKFQLYDICEDYEWVIFLDADVLINPKTVDFSGVVENNIMIVPEFINLKCEEPLFQFKNTTEKYKVNIYFPFYFLAFHKSQKNIVKPWKNPLRFKNCVNITKKMKTKNIKQEWHLDEFLLLINVVKCKPMFTSLKDDFTLNTISHNGNYLTIQEKLTSIRENIVRLQNVKKTKGEYV